MHHKKKTGILCPESVVSTLQEIYKNHFSRNKLFKVVLTKSILQDVLTNEDQNRIIEETHQRAHRGADENYAKFKICWFLFISLLGITNSSQLHIQNLYENPLLITSEKLCRVQTGNIKIIHPIDMYEIEQTVNLLTSLSYTKLEEKNPLTNIIKYRIKKLYTSFYHIKPQNHSRQKRWDSLGYGWKWIAGSPDAQDLRIINSTMNDLIEQNNQQYQVNVQINERIKSLTNAVNQITSNLHTVKIILDELKVITIILNIDIINTLLEDIQEAIILSKTSAINGRMLSIHEISVIRTLLQNQGIEIQLPDEALQFVTPKIVVNKEMLLYILSVPQLQNRTSTVIRIYPLVQRNQMIRNTPTHLIKNENTLYTTTNPEDYVQRSSNLKEFTDKCVVSLIFGRKTECVSETQNKTLQNLISENNLLIRKAKNQTLISTCGPDNRTLEGNFLINFDNCTIFFNEEKFYSSEYTAKLDIIQGAMHNVKVYWKLQKIYDIAHVNNQTISNRETLKHVYLRQNELDLKLWGIFGGLSTVSMIIVAYSSVIVFRTYNLCFWMRAGKRRIKTQRDSEKGLSEVEEGAVTKGSPTILIEHPDINNTTTTSDRSTPHDVNQSVIERTSVDTHSNKLTTHQQRHPECTQ
ncbi:uncharacterized protein LOC129772925 [Toxorhynchites rutilus septentrionalis]|uniref:uncharacterized protein LOC129772925 n=1 Tax=Toxorhynchites rutilus septentrionalis TaxID=329112 RepID=UPI002478B651|nr:uncharacterized protein LOC129772925 [Toxorhynchites rutilus septentrionalis]